MCAGFAVDGENRRTEGGRKVGQAGKFCLRRHYFGGGTFGHGTCPEFVSVWRVLLCLFNFEHQESGDFQVSSLHTLHSRIMAHKKYMYSISCDIFVYFPPSVNMLMNLVGKN